MEGIAKAKAEGVYKGRKPSIDPVKVRQLQAQGLGACEIAKRLAIGRASVYRVMTEETGQKGAVMQTLNRMAQRIEDARLEPPRSSH
jgi:DNA invertase Pin-like site-specific DNA recombinase